MLRSPAKPCKEYTNTNNTENDCYEDSCSYTSLDRPRTDAQTWLDLAWSAWREGWLLDSVALLRDEVMFFVAVARMTVVGVAISRERYIKTSYI